MNARFRCASAALLAVLGAGCGDADGRDGARVTVRDSVGVTIVENRGSGRDSASAWARSPEPLVTLGHVGGDDPATRFSNVRSVARLSDGRILVLDTQAAELRWFDREGDHLLTTGGRGRGPGEFNFPGLLMVLPGDTVAVEDRPRMDLAIFGPEGDFVRKEAFDLQRLIASGRYGECTSRRLPDRSALMCVYRAGEERPPPDPGPGHHRSFLHFVRLAPDLTRQDTLGLYGGLEQWGVSYGGRTAFALHPFHASTYTAVGGDPLRVAIARNPEYSVEVWTLDGRLDRIVRRIGARRAPTEDEARMAEERFLRFARDDEQLANRFLAEVEIPDSIPAVHDLEIARNGELWVGRTMRLPGPAARVYDVFGPDGEYLGAISFPAGFELHEIGEDYVLGTRLDELDVPFVELYGLRRR